MATLPSFVLDYSKILACVHGQRRRSGAACARQHLTFNSSSCGIYRGRHVQHHVLAFRYTNTYCNFVRSRRCFSVLMLSSIADRMAGIDTFGEPNAPFDPPEYICSTTSSSCIIRTGVNRGRTRQKRHRASTAYKNEPREDKTKRPKPSRANERQLVDQQGRLMGAEPAVKRM